MYYRWGQMSFWGRLLHHLFSFGLIPVVGMDITYWLWGGFSVDNATLNRFFSLQYLLPFIIAWEQVLYILQLLHQYGSNNPLGCLATVDKVSFYPYFFKRSCWMGMLCSLLFFFLSILHQMHLGTQITTFQRDPMSTPAHIVPEWYFLPVYAILKSIPNKLAGVAAIGLVFVSLLLLPFY